MIQFDIDTILFSCNKEPEISLISALQNARDDNGCRGKKAFERFSLSHYGAHAHRAMREVVLLPEICTYLISFDRGLNEMKKRILLVMAVTVLVPLAIKGHAELQVVKPNGVTVVPRYKIPHGEQNPEPTAPIAAATLDVAAILKQTEAYEQQCQAPEVGEAGPFPSAMLKLKTLFTPIKGRANWLPPDPGSAGKTTIEGIDSDGDCVRDDIEYFIARKFPNREQLKLRRHLFKLAKYLGLFLQPNLTRDAAAYYSANMFVATECARREMSQVPTASKDLDMIFAKFHNTLERSYRYIENSAQLGGTTSRIPDEINCDSLTPITTK